MLLTDEGSNKFTKLSLLHKMYAHRYHWRGKKEKQYRFHSNILWSYHLINHKRRFSNWIVFDLWHSTLALLKYKNETWKTFYALNTRLILIQLWILSKHHSNSIRFFLLFFLVKVSDKIFNISFTPWAKLFRTVSLSLPNVCLSSSDFFIFFFSFSLPLIPNKHIDVYIN